jgi:hypothetical protein
VRSPPFPQVSARTVGIGGVYTAYLKEPLRCFRNLGDRCVDFNIMRRRDIEEVERGVHHMKKASGGQRFSGSPDELSKAEVMRLDNNEQRVEMKPCKDFSRKD